MIFAVNREKGELQEVQEQRFAALDVLERSDFQEWVVNRPEILGEKLLVIGAEYAKFEETRDRLDVLALDPEGKLVVIELKRDEADDTTDLQAIKYASYCATLTATEIQRDYRKFWNGRGRDLSPEEVGQEFKDFLSGDGELTITDEGWASFGLDDRPRILLAAGSFGIQVTAPVMWLIEEYDLDITCVELRAYHHDGELLLNPRQVIPVQEAEEYMTRRRQKQKKQSDTRRRKRGVEVLLERGVLTDGDVVVFDKEKLPVREEWERDPGEDFWKAEVTGKMGRSNNFQWRHDGQEYSATGMAQALLQTLTGDDPGTLHGYRYWRHPE